MNITGTLATSLFTAGMLTTAVAATAGGYGGGMNRQSSQDASSLDAVVCTASVEYLVQPSALMAEVLLDMGDASGAGRRIEEALALEKSSAVLDERFRDSDSDQK